MIKKAFRRCVFPLSLHVFPSKLLPSSLQISPSLWPCMTPAELANQAPSSCKAGWLAHMHQQAQTRTAGNESLHQRLALDSSVHQDCIFLRNYAIMLLATASQRCERGSSKTTKPISASYTCPILAMKLLGLTNDETTAC